MPRELVILKVGGSVITRKDEGLLEVRGDVLARICRELRQALEAEQAPSLVLVHGAGPFGHRLVAQYGINGGLRSAAHREGFVRTHNSMEDLNYQVMCAMRLAGLWGFTVPPGAVVVQDGRRIVACHVDNIRRLLDLDRRIVPVLYGDMAPDLSLGGSVVSGDALVARLAADLGAGRVCLGTDVDGIFDADPRRDPGATLCGRLRPGDLDAAARRAGGALGTDVTGGMKKKLQEISDHVSGLQEAGVRTVSVFNALTPGNVARVLAGERPGTTIELDVPG